MRNIFKGGVHPDPKKELTENKAIVKMPAPEVAFVSLSQHIGKPARAAVEVGARVRGGEIIGVADGKISASVYAPFSGTVKSIETRPTPSGKAEHIVIENDGKYEYITLPPLTNPTPEEIVARVRECGIVGMGGAGFPTDVKLTPPSIVDTLIINAAECEPYITCDYRAMLDYTEDFLSGVKLLAHALKASRTVVAIEENKRAAAEKLAPKAESANIEIMLLPTRYPQGAEKQLVFAVTGKRVPLGGLPASVGVVVDNVHTALSVHYAVDGEPLYRRIVTVTGGGVVNPQNLWVYNGTLYDEVIEFSGGIKEDSRTVKMISGGPMMGIAVSGGAVACTKTTSCLLLLTADEAETSSPSPCINCGKCAKACPMRLMPMYMDLYSRGGNLDLAVKYGLNACIECGCCAFVCPAKRTLVQSFRLAKKQLKGVKK